MSIYIKNGKVVREDGIDELNILIEDEYIKKIDKPTNFSDKEVSDSEEIDAKGCYVFPGIIDAHTHYLLKSRNTVTADDFYSGSIASVFGGVTTFIDFINDENERDRTFKDSLDNRIKEARDSVVDYSFHQSVYDFNEKTPQQLRTIKDEGINNIKIYTTYRKEGYLIEEDKLYELFKTLKQLEMLPIVHAEDNEIIEKNQKKFKEEGKTDLKYHPDIRTAQSEAAAIGNIAELIDIFDMPGYIVHLSSKKGLEELRKRKANGVKITAETAPHYLVLDREWLTKEDGYLYYMTPPLRTKEDNESLWEGLVEDDIDVVATDHCAFDITQKKMGNDAFNTLPGIPGSETLLPLVYHFGQKKELDLVDMIKKLSINPAKIYGLYPQKGSLKENTDADLVIFDPEKSRELNSMFMHSNSGYSPYSHIEVEGFPITTISRGSIIVNKGAYRGHRGHGKFIKADKSSLY